MKKIIATTALLFVFTVFISVNSYSQTQEPVKKEEVKTHQCNGMHNAAKADTTKTETPKSGCASASSKCPSTCPHAKAAAEKNAEPANNEKRTPVPQK